MFGSLLVANRGEIACRIFRTARTMGLRTIAVYSEADRDAPHVRAADIAIPIGPAPATQSYLLVDAIIDAARQSGAEAIHPGYGFLSEQPELARACEAAGIGWVGPHAEAIETMGSKVASKHLAEDAGVPTVPGYTGEDQADDALMDAAIRVGLPVMIKASAGGGGKGMRAVDDEANLSAAILAARREAERSFGDGRLLIEKLIQQPRHIEVQVLGDKHGNVLHLFERDCSVQRHHQKLLEEAPAPSLTEATRHQLHKHAIALANRIGYDSAGTIEFILNAETEDFYFLEMNTRLQVEHTVTEEITGLDLVEQQLRIAAGERFEFCQSDVSARGHAVQARLTAENPADSFRPATGTVTTWLPPTGIRTDSGVRKGTEIGPHYDSLIAKLIALGPDRQSAISRLRHGLGDLAISGVTTNRAFLCDALSKPDFENGQATTEFIIQHWPNGWSGQHPDATTLSVLAMALSARNSANREPASPWQTLHGYRLLETSGRPAQTNYRVKGKDVLVQQIGDHFVLQDGEARRKLSVLRTDDGMEVTENEVAQRYRVEITGSRVAIQHAGWDSTMDVRLVADDVQEHSSASGRNNAVVAPMHGLLVDLTVSQGEQVSIGQTVAIFESMKLVSELKSPGSGTVVALAATPGMTVEAGVVLIEIDLTDKED